MMNWLKMTAVLLATVASTGSALADVKYTVYNRTDKAVWLTVYNAFGQFRTTRCMLPGTSKTLSEDISSLVYLRGELKTLTADCGGRTLSDTGRGQPIWIGKNTVKFFQAVDNKLYVR